MEPAHKNILLHLRKDIIDDLDIDNDIVEPLASNDILKTRDIQSIYTGATKEERAEKLLDILPRCGSYAFDVFHQSLKHHYIWLSEQVDKLLCNYTIENNGEIDYYVGPLNMPPLSPLTVTREEKITQLKMALQQLKPTEYIVLHGMKGFGKSSLTANTLKDIRLVKNLFSNQIYWIKFTCDRSVDEEILIQLNTLYHNVRNLEIQPESFTPLEQDSLIRFFKYYFAQQDNRNALLILDDVSDKKIINAFDFKCKTLVLTADINVLEEKIFNKIEMNDGFTETETLGLFAKVLEMDVDKLPIEAKRIHEECKGMPLLIAMFAAQFKEFKCDMRINTKRWKYYLESLKKKDAKNKVIREFFKKQETIFDMCIGQLQSNLKKYYKSLAIFNEDVNITSKTLSILWEEEDIYQVDELMLDLCHKSLVAKKWNKDLKSYIYGVHDLLLCHLRTKLTQDELIQMHKSVIEKYREHCNNDFSKLPDDNYIYSYIGHHLEEAKLFEEFPKLYLDFSFIQAKIMHSGLTDLLLDLQKYKSYITCSNNEYEAHFSNIERFLQEQANIIVEHRRKKCLDIIQIAMNHPYQDYVTQTAKQLAMRKGNYLYLSHDKTLENVNISLIHETSMDICTSSFTDYSHLILIGTTRGKIILWNCKNMQQQIFNGHNEECSIKKLIVSTNGDCFLSLSSAGIIKLFPLLLNDAFEPNDQGHTHMESPRQKQSAWSNMFTNNNGLDDSVVEFSIKDEMILDMAFGYEDQYIAACTNKTKIRMWNRKGELVFTIKKDPTEIITKIAFTAQALLLHVIDESKMAFTVYSNCSDDYTAYRYLACYNLQLKSEKVIFFHHVPRHNDSLMIATEKQAICVKWWWDGDNVHSFCKQRKVFIENSPKTYVCATITYDGEYMIMADSAGFINVWQTSGGYPFIAIYKSRVTSLDTYCLEEEGCHIICGNGNRLFYKWNFPIQESNTIPRKCLFDAIVKPYDETDIIVKESQLKKIIVSHGEETIEVESKEKIVNLQLSPDGKEVVYVTEKYNLILYDITNETSYTILKLEKLNIFLKIINICNCNVIMCGWNNSNLMMWQHSKQIFGTDIPAGHIIDIHKLNNNHMAIITQSDIKTIWFNQCTETIFSELISQVPFDLSSDVTFSCFSHNKTYLAVLNESNQLVLYCFCKNRTVLLPCIEINEQPYYTCLFPWKATCCDISQTEQYIAVGTERGQIIIIDIRKRTEIIQLSFHNNPITQLFWAPTTVKVPILLSVTNNELVWWNIALTKSNVKRSRMGIRSSISTPSLSLNAFRNLQIPSSRSLDADISNLQNNNISDIDITVSAVRTVSEYWVNKTGRDPEVPELLAVVELPPNPDTKLLVSTDFSKFITIDMYGSISTFKLIDYNISKLYR